MATRRQQYPENWSPVPQRIAIRPVQREPRDERTQFARSSDRALRPKPLNLPSKQPTQQSVLKSAQALRKESSESYETPRDPELIDVGTQEPWQRRVPSGQRNRRMQSPSTASQYSTRQSEISLGILDYYIRDPSPSLHSPELPPPTPKLDAAIEQFDFGLPPTPTPSASSSIPPVPPPKNSIDKKRSQQLIPISPPSTTKPTNAVGKGYTLFPVIKEVTPPRHPAITHIPPLTLRDITPGSTYSTPPSSVIIPSHPSSDPIHRPRKESISSSVRTRNDSINSMRHKQVQHQRGPIPLRILSSSSTATTSSSKPTPIGSRRTTSISISTPSPPYNPTEPHSRWSDDTITSPSLAPTPGPRTSFGSLLRRDSAQYPDCFFEDDDDESAPLRRKWAWKRSVNSSSTVSESLRESGQKGRWEEEDIGGEKLGGVGFWKAFLCGCGGRK